MPSYYQLRISLKIYSMLMPAKTPYALHTHSFFSIGKKEGKSRVRALHMALCTHQHRIYSYTNSMYMLHDDANAYCLSKGKC